MHSYTHIHMLINPEFILKIHKYICVHFNVLLHCWKSQERPPCEEWSDWLAFPLFLMFPTWVVEFKAMTSNGGLMTPALLSLSGHLSSFTLSSVTPCCYNLTEKKWGCPGSQSDISNIRWALLACLWPRELIGYMWNVMASDLPYGQALQVLPIIIWVGTLPPNHQTTSGLCPLVS